MFVCGASLTAIFYSLDGLCHQCSFFFPAPESFFTYLIFIILYIVCLLIYYFKAKIGMPRHTILPWIWFLLIVYLTACLGSGIVYFGQSDFGFCVMNFIMIIYALFLPPFLHRALKNDSDYLSSEETDYRKSV